MTFRGLKFVIYGLSAFGGFIRLREQKMNSQKQTLTRIDALFHARSVAIVGLPRGMKTGKLFLMALLDQGFRGPIYPVNPGAGTIDGLKAYARVTDIPGPVDLVIVLVPHHHTLAVVRDCAAKGVKGIVLFTSGYRETGTTEGARLQDKILHTARAADIRIIGPNGMGLYCPKTGLSFFPQLSRDPGPVGIISHSGSLSNILGIMAPEKAIRFSKVVSLGNECDLSVADFLNYLGHDPETTVIGGYIEGIQHGPAILAALKAASLIKPVILWKIGLTAEGSRAASSHTGALAGTKNIWEGMVNQGGAISVTGFEDFIDTLMGFSLLPQGLGRHMAILSGPGGLAVSAAEACGNEGLALADMLPGTRSKMAEFVPATGTSLRNPIDVGLSASLDISIYAKAAQSIASDPGVDAVIVIGIGLTNEANEEYFKAMVDVRKKSDKPFMIIKMPGFAPELGRRFCEAGLPFFDSTERAVATYARVWRYQRWQKKQMAAM